MKLLTKELEKDGKGERTIVYAKLFLHNWTWYITEYNPEDGTCFGLVDGSEVELGYFNIYELNDVISQWELE